MRQHRSSIHWLAPVIALVVAGCGGDGAIIGEQVPNSAPETRVTATPPTLTETGYTVSFFWTGSDPDGEITGFEWRISDNGPDGVVDRADTLGLAWNSTEVTDSTFTVTADMADFPVDQNNPDLLTGRDTNGDGIIDVYVPDPSKWRFWQTHTFFVRAIDNKGLRDPSPANVSFTATTLSPYVTQTLASNGNTNSCTSGPLALAFGWEGVDPDNPTGAPESVRYKLIRWGGPADPCLLKFEFQQMDVNEEYADIPWSPWIRYDAPQDSGKVVRFSPQGVTSGDSFIFLVQARDLAGAVTPTFEWGRNMWHVKTSSNKLPKLDVSEKFLGSEDFLGIGEIRRFSIVSEQPLEFNWSASAESYGGLIEGYKYGFEVTDPDDPNDPGWFVDWGTGANWQRSPQRRFTQGSPNFVVQTRDNSGTISRGVFQFQVIQIAQRSEQKDLLLVDDLPDVQSGVDLIYDAAWTDVLRNVRGFQAANNSIDAETQSALLTFALANEYKGLVWFTGPSDQTYLATRLAPQSTTIIRFNWLEIYQRFVGNVFIIGSGVMRRTIENLPAYKYPIVFNVGGTANIESFGTITTPDGRQVNRGTQRYPYTGWCLESIDRVRPAGIGEDVIFGEIAGRRPLRDNRCDALAFARVAPDFIAANPAVGPQQVGNLLPTAPRLSREAADAVLTNRLNLNSEEFYNRNVTVRDVSLSLRTCQTPMFLHIARSDIDEPAIMDPSAPDPDNFASPADSAFVVEFPEYRLSVQPSQVAFVPDPLDESGLTLIKDCGWAVTERRKNSRLTGAPVAIVSSAFVDEGTKQNGSLRSKDVVFGFNPFGFQTAQVRLAVEWVLLDEWGLND